MKASRENTALAVYPDGKIRFYIDNTAYLELFDGSGFYKVSAYTGQPELLDPLAESIQGVLRDKADVTASDALYQQMKAPLTQITRVVSLMRLLTFFTGTVIVSLLLCMWMQSRQKEMARLYQHGRTENHHFFTGALEAAVVSPHCPDWFLRPRFAGLRLAAGPAAVLCGNKRFFAGFLTIYGYSFAIGDWQRSVVVIAVLLSLIACNPGKSERYFITNGGINDEFYLGGRSVPVFRKPVKSLLLLLVVCIISLLFLSGYGKPFCEYRHKRQHTASHRRRIFTGI